MKLLRLFASSLLLAGPALARVPAASAVVGGWDGIATVHGQQVPVHLQITGSGSNLQAALTNGPESSQASSVALTGNHLLITFNYYARTLDATLAAGKLTGTFGTSTVRYPLELSLPQPGPFTDDCLPQLMKDSTLGGDWEVQVKSAKGESAWTLHLDVINGRSLRAVIQRIDGDTGSLYSRCVASPAPFYDLFHFTAAGPALYRITPQPDGTLLLTNLLRANLNPPDQQSLIARRPAEARKQNLPTPTDPTQQTTIKNPAVPFAFSFPNLKGRSVSNTDPQFQGKVVIVAVGGSWCPNCHDEAPFLESLYQQFHSRGLEIVDLSFEEADQLRAPARLRAFIERYRLTYTILLAGDPDQLNDKIPQAEHLNSWPTSFFLGRDGRVREVHAGFASAANPAAHEALVRNTTALVEELLREPAPSQSAQR